MYVFGMIMVVFTDDLINQVVCDLLQRNRRLIAFAFGFGCFGRERLEQ